MGTRNYLDEYVFESLSTKTGYLISGLTIYDIRWVDTYNGSSTDTDIAVATSRTTETHRGLHLYDYDDGDGTSWRTVDEAITGPSNGCISLAQYYDTGNEPYVMVGTDSEVWWYHSDVGVEQFMATASLNKTVYSLTDMTVASSTNYATTLSGLYYYNGSSWDAVVTGLDNYYPKSIAKIDSDLYTGSLTGIHKGESATTWSEFSSGAYFYDIPESDIYKFLSIPTMVGEITGQTLVEGTDYQIEDLRTIKFLKQVDLDGDNPDGIEVDQESKDHLPGERFLIPSAIVLLPSLTNIYFKAFGATENPEEIILGNYYQPYLSGITRDLLTHYEYSQYYADHLKTWAQVYAAKLRQPPTLKNLTDAYGLVKAIPFSYYDSSFVSTTSDDDYVYATFLTSGTTDTTLTYAVPQPMQYWEYEVGESVEKGDLLCSGIKIVDAIKDSVVISGLLLSGMYTNYKDLIL